MLPRFATFAALCGCLAAQSARPVADLLPASTYVVARFAGLDACCRAAEELPLARLIEGCVARLPDETRRERIDARFDRAAGELQRRLQQVGLTAEDLRAVLAHPIALAVGRLTIEGAGPSLCLLVEEVDAGPAIGRCRAALSKAAAQHGVEVTTTRIAGHDVEVLQHRGAPPVFVTSIGGWWLVSNSRGQLAEIAACALGEARSLGARLATAGGAAEPALVSWFLDANTLVTSLEPHLPYETEALTAAFGLGLVRSLHVSAGAGVDSLTIEVDGSERGLAKVLFAAPARFDFARACSDDTVVFGAIGLDAAGFLEAARTCAELLPASLRDELQHEIGPLLHVVHSQRVQRLAQAFGPQVQVALAFEPGLVRKPELLAHVAVRDAGAAAAGLQQLEAAVERQGLEWHSRQVGEHEIRFCRVRIGEGPQLSPCYVLRPDGLWLASDTAAMVRALRQYETPETSFAAAADHAEMLQYGAGANIVLHVRSFRAVELGWREVEFWIAPQLDERRDELGFGQEVLPDAEEVARAVGTSTVCARVTGEVVSVTARNPVAYGSLLAGAGWLVDELLARCAVRVY